MDKVQVLARSRSDFAGGVDELTFRGTGTLEKTDRKSTRLNSSH